MRLESRQRLLDALEAAEEIISFSENWRAERVTGLAVERLLLIVGEALSRVRDTEPELLDRITDWQLIVGMRNAIVHGYNKLDQARIGAAIRDDLPVLIRELDGLVGEYR